MAAAVEAKYDALPKGFRHTFLIRDPVKVFTSYREMIIRLFALTDEQRNTFRLTDMPADFVTGSAKYKFGEMLGLLHYLQKTGMESNPVVIDADDLQSHPESILRQYCEAVGIPFSPGFLQWESGVDITNTWITSKKIMRTNIEKRGGFYSKALASSKFEPPKSLVPDKSELTPDIIQFAEAADKYYKELYEMRLKP
ncbi:uncharacterized protein [Amphiura filiformis]|uniref:uncharacterized protein n=1 Tax=Amphiura filiformis TaxID=82378 RepID=UPI003B22267D